MSNSGNFATFMRRGFVLLLLLLLRPACGGGGGGGGGGSFKVVLSLPAPAPAASRLPVVYVRFSKDYDETSINGTTFTVNDGSTNVTGTFVFEHCHKELQWMPNSALLAGTLHTVTLTTGVLDLKGSPLAAQFQFTFTTSAQTTDTTRPDFATGVTGATAADKGSVDLTWTAATDASAVTYEIFVSTESGCFDFTTPSMTSTEAAGDQVTGLLSNTQYYFVVRARDAFDNTDLNTVEVGAKTHVSFSADIYQKIVRPECRTCHTTGEGSDEVPTMDYSSAATTYATWVDIVPTYPAGGIGTCTTPPPAGARRVKPGGGAGAVDDSYLYNKVKSELDGVAPWCGEGMPKTGGALSAAQVQTIYDWIFQGAPNN